MIFVDTGAWFALATPADPDHQAATRYLASAAELLVTSDYIVDELLTLFIARRQKPKGMEWIDDVLLAGGTRLVRVQSADFDEALKLYRTFADKQWSFTDCTSYALISRLAIDKAFSFDEHFRQFGKLNVGP